DFQLSGKVISAINWPATSSITTKEGSALRLARATLVDAGIPTRITTPASTIATQYGLSASIPRAIAHQSTTVAADAHVPGPGRSRPTPKNVTSVVRLPRGSRFTVFTVWRIFQIRVFRVTNRAGNYIGAAGPLSQIDQPAAVAAEGEIWLVAQNYFLAGRTA